MRFSIFLSLCFLSSVACAPKLIPGTLVSDTPQNRSLVSVVVAYKQAFETRNLDAIIDLCSTRYYEDNGNADPNDDYGYSALRDHILKDTFKHLSDVQLEIEVKEIKVKDDYAAVDLRYFYKAKMALAAGDKWHADAELNRIELLKENGQWRIVSGL